MTTMNRFDATSDWETLGTATSLDAVLQEAINMLASTGKIGPYAAVVRWNDELGELYSADDEIPTLDDADWIAVGLDGMQLAVGLASNL